MTGKRTPTSSVEGRPTNVSSKQVEAPRPSQNQRVETVQKQTAPQIKQEFDE